MYTADEIRGATTEQAKLMVRENIAQDDTWLIRGILALYARQTQDEKDSESTEHDNKMGFNGFDAEILSSFSKQILAWQAQAVKQYASPLSAKQVSLARKKMGKYAGQLARIARGE